MASSRPPAKFWSPVRQAVSAWQRSRPFDDIAQMASRWSELMTVWDDPHSSADGILDDETYDWLGVFEAMRRDGGHPVTAAESDIVRAHQLATSAGYNVSATGSAGTIAAGDRLTAALAPEIDRRLRGTVERPSPKPC